MPLKLDNLIVFRSDWSNHVVAVVTPEERNQHNSSHHTSHHHHHHHHPSPPPSPPPSPTPDHKQPHKSHVPKYKVPFIKLQQLLQSNKLTRQLFPPKGNTSVALTLSIASIALFLVFRTILGPYSSAGGPIFSLMVLIFLGLVVGQIMKIGMFLAQKYAGISIRVPPFIGMIAVGILLRNVPYNFSQYQRPECYVTINHTEVHIDSINVLVDPVAAAGHGHAKRSADGELEFSFARLNRSIRSPEGGGVVAVNTGPISLEESCRPRYIARDFSPVVSGICRSVCLTVILLMAGLELDPVALQKLAGILVIATLIPCITETIAGMVLSHFILGFDWMVGAMLGILLTGISPAVIIPSVLTLSAQGYGMAKGIPTLTIACCAADDVFAIAGFGILSGLYFNKEASTTRLIIQGPIEVIVGFLFGFFWGGIAQYLPDKNHHNVKFFRWLLLFCGGLISIFGSVAIGYAGSGGVATVVGAFLCRKHWCEQGWDEHNAVEKTVKKMWIILGPVIFGLVGSEVQADKLDGLTVALGLAVLVGAVIIRMFITYFAVWCSNFTWKERLFFAVAWMPKATVQAALGPIFLAKAKAAGLDAVTLSWGEQIVTISVLSIVIFAPLGAIAIMNLGPMLLDNTPLLSESLDEISMDDTGKKKEMNDNNILETIDEKSSSDYNTVSVRFND
jgi:NhaP-type Na+/H+ or K+/H+ antiporter